MVAFARTSTVVAVCLFLGLGARPSSGLAEEMRTWTDAAGRKVDAAFVRVFQGEVILDKAGQMLKVPVSRLSAADQKYIREMTNSGTPAVANSKDATNAQPAAAKPAEPKDPASATSSSPLDAKKAAAELRRMREWQDSAGKSVRARFERFLGAEVLLMQGNTPRKVAFSRLSTKDQEFLRKSFEAQGRSGEIPTVVAMAPGSGENGGQVGADRNAAETANSSALPLPNLFGEFANLARSQQEQMQAQQDHARSSHDQIRAQMEQMRSDMQAARQRIRQPPTPRAIPSARPGSFAAQNGNFPPGHDAAGQSQIASAAPIATPAGSRAGPPSAVSPAQLEHDAWVRSRLPQGPAANRNPVSAGEQMPSNPPVAAPDPFATARSLVPQYQEVIVCGACKKEQKPGFKAGDRCQHCGQIIDEITDESGEVVDRSVRQTGRNIKFWVWAAITVISIIGGAIAKLKR